jgi:predicted ATPase
MELGSGALKQPQRVNISSHKLQDWVSVMVKDNKYNQRIKMRHPKTTITDSGLKAKEKNI